MPTSNDIAYVGSPYGPVGTLTITHASETCWYIDLSAGVTIQMTGGSLSQSTSYTQSIYGGATFAQSGGTNTVPGDLEIAEF